MSKKLKKSENKSTKALKIVAFILAAVIVLGVVGVYSIFQSGIIERNVVAAKTENYTVTTPMLSYLYRVQYQNFVNNSYSYLSYLGLDTNKSLDSQEYAGEKTWHDYMLETTRTQLKEALVLCEAAKAAGIELTDDDMDDINETLKVLEEYAASSNVSVSQYVKYAYGNAVSIDDIREAMSILRLAEIYQEHLTDSYNYEKADWDKYYAENEDQFLKVDYLHYTFTVETTSDDKDDSETTTADSDDSASDTTAAAEEEEKEPAIEATYAEELKNTTTPEEFKAYVENYLRTVKYVDFTAEELEEDDIVIEDLVEDCLKEAQSVSSETTFTKWAKDEARVPYETLVNENTTGTQYDVYMILPAQNEGDLEYACLYRETYQLKTFRYIPVTFEHDDDASEEDEAAELAEAKETADKILKEWQDDATEENFAILAGEDKYGDGYYEGGLVEGADIGVINDDFSDWLYSDERKEGDVEIIEDEHGYYIVYFIGDYGVKWEANANVALKNDKYAEDYDALEQATPVTFYKKGVNLVPSA